MITIGVDKRPRSKGDKFPFILTSLGEPCGSRNIRDVDNFPLEVNPKAILHSYECGWNRFATKAEAETAAVKLEAHVNGLEKKSKKKLR